MAPPISRLHAWQRKSIKAQRLFAEFILLIFANFCLCISLFHIVLQIFLMKFLRTSKLIGRSTVQLPCISVPFLPSFFWLRRALRLRLRFLLRSSPISLLNANAFERHVPPALREELELRRFRSWHTPNIHNS